jgi:hypothetical protein
VLVSNTHFFAPYMRDLLSLPFGKAVFDLRRVAARRFPGPATGEKRSPQPSLFRCHPTASPILCSTARSQGPDATKRANRGWARWEKTVQLASLTSSYSSLQGADSYSGASIIQGSHGGITKGSISITHSSQVHAVSRCTPWKGGAHLREKSLSLGQRHYREAPIRHGGVSSGARRQRTKTNLSPSGSCSSLAQFPLCAPLLRRKGGLLALWFLVPGSPQTQKIHLLLNHLRGWLCVYARWAAFCYITEILCKRIS